MTIRVVEFETKYGANNRAVDWVRIGPQGPDFQNTQTWHRVKTLMPGSKPDMGDHRTADTINLMKARWEIIGPQYEAWKGGQELPESGTPLAAWSGVSPEAAKHLRNMGIRSVEDVGAMADDDASRLAFPNSRELPRLARAFLESKDATNSAAELQALKDTIAEMQETIDAKPKRGRPAKADKIESELV